MAEAIVRARAVRWVSDDEPGWIEVRFVDADEQEHRIIEKVPVLTTRQVTAESAFPAEFWLRADSGQVDDARVQVTFAYGVETTAGRSGVEMRTADVKWL